MAAFQFPDPNVTTTVKNPITGSTYQWKEPPGKWVLTTSVNTIIEDIEDNFQMTQELLYEITRELEQNGGYTEPGYWTFEGDIDVWDTPNNIYIAARDENGYEIPDLDEYIKQGDIIRLKEDEDNYGIYIVKHLERRPQFDGFPGDSYYDIETEEVLAFKGKPNDGQSHRVTFTRHFGTSKDDEQDLQQVLNKGNIADKDIVLTDGVDDLIDISQTEGRIIIASDTDAKTPKLTLAHFGDHENGNRKAEIELDENGTRLDFEMSNDVKDVHFRFGDDEKFIINHEGDAEFTGKVKIDPGTEGNEAVTFDQLVNLGGVNEEIKEEREKGDWIAELPSKSSDDTRELVLSALTFPEAQGRQSKMTIKEIKNQLGHLKIEIDPLAMDAESQALYVWLQKVIRECNDDEIAFEGKYSFFCPQAEEKGFMARRQRIRRATWTGTGIYFVSFDCGS